MDELRRAYHDRLADLHTRTIELLDDVVEGLENVTVALQPAAPAPAEVDLEAVRAVIGAVAAEVLDLLAQQAPVARDLRLILAAQRIAQLAELCLGLERALVAGAPRVESVLSQEMLDTALEIGRRSGDMLRAARGAWATLDEEGARRVLDEAAVCHQVHRRFMSELLSLRDVPIEAAVDLAMAARAFERLADHGAEMAAEVVFAATGQPAAAVLAS